MDGGWYFGEYYKIMSRIFISYKRVDKDKVLKIKDQIESALCEKCWMDLDGIESDAQFKDVIIKAINECEIVLFMYSKSHAKIVDFENDWTVRELNFAQKKSKRIVFVNLDGSPLSDLFEFDYGTKQQVDASSQQSMLKLIADLRTWLGKLPAQTPDCKPSIKKYRICTLIAVIMACFGVLLSICGNNRMNTWKERVRALNRADAPRDSILCYQCNGTGIYSGSRCSACSGHGYIVKYRKTGAEYAAEEYIRPRNGWYYYDDGTFSETRALDKQCVGVIFGVGKTSDEERKRGFENGYVMALDDACGHAVQWGNDGYQTKNTYNSIASAITDVDGYFHSFMEGEDEEGDRTDDKYSAFYFASSYSEKLPSTTSGWYLPSVGQWNMFIEDVLDSSFGEKWKDAAKSKLREMNFKTASYWTSTDFGCIGLENGFAWNMEMSIESCATLDTCCRDSAGLSRPIAAF